MRGLGTIINALAIVMGGVLGILFKRFLKERYQDTIIKATGFSVVFLGAAGTLSKMLTVRPDEMCIRDRYTPVCCCRCFWGCLKSCSRSSAR